MAISVQVCGGSSTIVLPNHLDSDVCQIIITSSNSAIDSTDSWLLVLLVRQYRTPLRSDGTSLSPKRSARFSRTQRSRWARRLRTGDLRTKRCRCSTSSSCPGSHQVYQGRSAEVHEALHGFVPPGAKQLLKYEVILHDWCIA